jgi:hypothetical protein
MPRILAHPATWLLGMAALLVPFLVKIPLSLRRNPIIAPLGDQFHVVLPAAITLMLYWRGPFTGRIWRAAGAAAVIGGAIEFLQLLVGREALWHDFLLDLLGIGMVAGWVLWRGYGSRRGRLLLFLLLLYYPVQLRFVPVVIAGALRARQIFPVVADFEAGRDRWLWQGMYETEPHFVAVPDGPHGPTRVLRFEGAPPEQWPGARMRRFPHDWTAFTRLVFTARSTGPAEVRVGVRLEDFAGGREERHARANVTVTPGWRDYAIDLPGLMLTDGSRPLNLADVDIVHFFLPRPKAPLGVEIDDIRLE